MSVSDVPFLLFARTHVQAYTRTRFSTISNKIIANEKKYTVRLVYCKIFQYNFAIFMKEFRLNTL